MEKITILICLLFVNIVFADQPRMRFSFKSANLRFELKPCDTIFSDGKIYRDSIFDKKTNSYYKSEYTLADKYHWGLYDTKTNQKLYTIKNADLGIEMRSVEISNDGENIVIIDDFSAGIGVKSTEIVTFYKKDVLLKSLSMGDLVNNLCSLSYSVSHMRWCSNWGFDHNMNFFIDTYEFYKITTNLQGDILSKISSENIRENDNIIVAKISRLSNNKYKMEINICIRGELLGGEEIVVYCKDKKMKKIHGRFYGFLKSKNKIMERGFFETVIINNNQVKKINFAIPTYNSPQSCSYFNQLDY